MPSPIKKVVLIGAGGNLGPSILKELLSSSLFRVTVLSRVESTATFPSGVQVVKTDYSSDSLRSAFKDQDAVVCIVGDDGVSSQRKIIDAAIAAGVKRFLPSEFGSDTASAEVRRVIPVTQEKRDVVEYLISKESDVSWTALATGPFFDWGLKVGFLEFNIAERKATLWDEGIARWDSTNVSTIGKAVIAILSDRAYEKTRNRYVYVSSHKDVTQKDILASFEKLTGQKWQIATEDAQKRLRAATEKFQKGDYSDLYSLIQAATFGKDGELERFSSVWNEELGLPQESLDESVKDVLEELTRK